jgi:hypothetical protein
MIFYLVPAAAGRPAQLQPTQADANREARERGLKVRAPDMEHEVPTVKAELMAYINDLMAGPAAEIPYTVETVRGPIEVDLKKLECDPTPEPTGFMSQQEVDELFKPRAKAPLPRERVCEAISDMTGTDLGFVALEVACRFETLGKVKP